MNKIEVLQPALVVRWAMDPDGWRRAGAGWLRVQESARELERLESINASDSDDATTWRAVHAERVDAYRELLDELRREYDRD